MRRRFLGECKRGDSVSLKMNKFSGGLFMRNMVRTRRNRPRRNYRPFVEELRSRLAPAVLAGFDAEIVDEANDFGSGEGEIAYDDAATSYVVEGDVSDSFVGQDEIPLDEMAFWSFASVDGIGEPGLDFPVEESFEDFSISDDLGNPDDTAYLEDLSVQSGIADGGEINEGWDERYLFNVAGEGFEVEIEMVEPVYRPDTDFDALPNGGDLNGDGEISLYAIGLPPVDSSSADDSPELVDLGTDTLELSFTSGLADSSSSTDSSDIGVPSALTVKVVTVQIETVHGSIGKVEVHIDPVIISGFHFEVSHVIKLDVGNLPLPEESEGMEADLDA